ncbi:hamartin [Culicoides brevitarsis]|uniref:hamartin n=1 Tax=Culicoides brevitarsis TaxID=469753 RepID=UPI00307C8725
MESVTQLFEDLDNTNNQQNIEESKRKLVEVFNMTKDSWLVHGFIDYYSHTMSERVLDVLAKVSQPHDKFIFDRLCELMREKDTRGVSNNKQMALNVFGYLVRANPTWLYKVTNHGLLREILKLLKNDNDVVIYMSALWSIIALLPIVPSSVAQYLHDLFDVFGHLAAWKDSQVLNEVEHLNLQIGLIFLFTRLYGMYPCNFMDYIKTHYIANKDKQSIYQHTIKGLIDTVKLHPLIMTATKETEISPARWKKMEPHDVVFECARLSLEYNERPQDFVNDCTTRHLTPVPLLLSDSSGATIRVSDLMLPNNKALASIQNDKFESIWSPSNVVHATPPPTGALSSHTSTPTPNLHNFGMQPPNSQQQQHSDSSSPPEAAVEATPETTPMKDNVKNVHSLPTNSTIARAIWNTSQPSSPLKKDSSPFRFSAAEIQDQNTGTNQRLMKLMDDRSIAVNHLKQSKMVVSPPTVGNADEDKEDQEVRVINSRPMDVPVKPVADDMMANFENEGSSPCSVGGLHIPFSRSVYELKNKVNRLRLVSNCIEDASFSAGTSPDAHGNIMVTRGNKQTRIRRFNSCPRMSLNAADSTPIYDLRRESKSSSNKRNDKPPSQHSKKLLQQIRDDLLTKSSGAFGRTDASVQTVKTVFDQPYDGLMSATINEEKEIKSRNSLPSIDAKIKSLKSPYELLDKVIEIAGTRNIGGSGAVKTVDEYKESLNLIHLQLQYEKHRREVHADRNRRLLGMTRKIHQYEQSHQSLTEQNKILMNDLQLVNDQLTKLRYTFNLREQEMLKETEVFRNKYHVENEENQKLRALVEQLRAENAEYSREKKETHLELEKARGELFDVKNELRQMMIQAELVNRYKDELNHLQSEVIMMGEVQLKCKEKFSSIGLLDAKDYKISLLQESYMEEISNLKAALESKKSSLETALLKVTDLENQLTRRDVISADLKRDLKRTKEEYEEKINALEKKYTAQKAIMLRKDEHILELYKNRSPVNMTALSPDSERGGVSEITAGSLDHASSPLSLSQTSSDGLSASFSKSVTEIRNLQALVQQSTSTVATEITGKSHPADIPTTSNQLK